MNKRRQRYQTYMKSESWRQRRKKYYKTHKKECRACGTTKNIELHHKTYVRLRKERDADMVPLCVKCHNAIHVRVQRDGVNLWRATEEFIRNKRKSRGV